MFSSRPVLLMSILLSVHYPARANMESPAVHESIMYVPTEASNNHAWS